MKPTDVDVPVYDLRDLTSTIYAWRRILLSKICDGKLWKNLKFDIATITLNTYTTTVHSDADHLHRRTCKMHFTCIFKFIKIFKWSDNHKVIPVTYKTNWEWFGNYVIHDSFWRRLTRIFIWKIKQFLIASLPLCNKGQQAAHNEWEN